MEKPDSLIVRHSFRVNLKELSMAERGRLFTAMLEYSSTGEEPVLGGSERYIWPAAKDMIDETSAAYIYNNNINITNKASIASITNKTNIANREDMEIGGVIEGGRESNVRHRYGQYDNVLLTDADLEKLKAEFPDDWEERIERLSEYVASSGKKYKSHLATIRAWARKDRPIAPKKPAAPSKDGLKSLKHIMETMRGNDDG